MGMVYVFNPFTGTLDVVNVVERYYAVATSGSVVIPNNGAVSGYGIPSATITVAASNVARVFAVHVSYSTNSSINTGSGFANITVVLDPGGGATAYGFSDGVRVINSPGSGFTAGYHVNVSVPGDDATHVLAMGLYQPGTGTGVTVTTLRADISAVQVA